MRGWLIRGWPQLAVVALVVGCNTAAQFDLEAEEVVAVAVAGVQRGCGEGASLRLTAALVNQRGGPVRVGGARLPRWPGDAARRFEVSLLSLDGVPIEGRTVSARPAQWPADGEYGLWLDRPLAACGGTLTAAEAVCSPRPCFSTEATCTPERGCCPAGEVCVADAPSDAPDDGRHRCVTPAASGCAGCEVGAVCVEGACHVQRFGAMDADDRWVEAFLTSAARLLDAEAGRLAPPVGRLWAWSGGGLGAQVLGGRAPLRSLAPLVRAVERSLLPPLGASALLHNLARVRPEGPMLVWGLRPGPATEAVAEVPHLVIIPDHGWLSQAEAEALQRLTCDTDGALLRLPSEHMAAVVADAGVGLPAALRSRVQVDLTLDAPLPPGPHRLRGRLQVDVRGLVAGGTRPAVPVLVQDFDAVVEGRP